MLLFSQCAAPKAAFTVPSQTVRAAEYFTFTNTSQQASSYAWDFGDGRSSTEAAPRLRYFKSGDYTVRLIQNHDSNHQRDSTQRMHHPH